MMIQTQGIKWENNMYPLTVIQVGRAHVGDKMRVCLSDFVIMIEVNRYIFSNLEKYKKA